MLQLSLLDVTGDQREKLLKRLCYKFLWDVKSESSFASWVLQNSIDSPVRWDIKTESTMKLSINFNYQWTKTLYQNLNNITFFFKFFKGYRCNELSVITPKKILMRARESKCQISQHDISHEFFRIYLCFLVKFNIYFLRLPWELVFGVIKDNYWQLYL